MQWLPKTLPRPLRRQLYPSGALTARSETLLSLRRGSWKTIAVVSTRLSERSAATVGTILGPLTTFCNTRTAANAIISVLVHMPNPEGCFLGQFYRSVRKADYQTLRNGFKTAHLAPGSKFNCQKYIKRSLEDDFKVLEGVSPVLWASVGIFLLINIDGWRVMFLASLLPVIIILAVGTKLQAILSRMALEITERHPVVQGIPLVHGSDKYFWFGRPQLVLSLIHFSLFQNAFQRIGFGVLGLCSYITLPLYALVTQTGSRMKKSIFDEQTSKALKKWHNAVKKKQGTKAGGRSPARSQDGSTIGVGSSMHSPRATLHRFKTTGHSTCFSTYEDHEESDFDAEAMSSPSSTTNLIVRGNHDEEDPTEENEAQYVGRVKNENDFTFVKPSGPH